jgi:hypothetical protein
MSVAMADDAADLAQHFFIGYKAIDQKALQT